jgi:hypothetical protein
MKKVWFFVLLTAVSGCSSVPTAFSLARDSGRQEGVLQKEDEAFQKLKRDLETRHLWSGARKADVEREYGPPVAVLKEDDVERWLYKARGGNWFGAPKIYLVFDATGKLQDLEGRRVFS